MKIYVYILIYFLCSCIKPTDPDNDGNATFSQAELNFHIDTYGEAMDVDLTENNMVVAANYQGFIVYDLARDASGKITSVDSIFNDSDMDGTMGDNRAQEVIISQTHNIAFITDIYDRIWLHKLNNGSNQYVDNYLSDCYGGTWLNVAIDDQSDHINVFTLVKHSSSESDDDGTIGDFDEYSTSVVWKKLYDINDADFFPELNASPSCEFSYNFGILPETIYFSDGLLAVSNGELGVKVLKQLNQSSCFDDQNELIEDFQSTGDIDSDRIACENSVFDYNNPGLGGNYEPEGGFYPYVFSSFDLPGEVNSVMIRDSIIFSGLSTSNGCYISLLDSNGIIGDNLAIANGYTINNISEDNGIVALSVGHDGILLYYWDGGLNINFMGQIETPYANSVKVDGDNIIISTEDGIFIYFLK
tara:strand:+ start:1579 stop:2826 length:1248 start_codon:yes stop_codon:yes gene_type:complete